MSVKDHEYRLMEAISEDSGITQATLASRLGMAVGSVNWHIKRLISRGYLKVTRMDRTRLRYNLTPEGMSEFTRNASQYLKDSLKIYREFRKEAQTTAELVASNSIGAVCLDGNDEIMDIMRLTCIEAGIRIESPAKWAIKLNGRGYELYEKSPKATQN